MSQLLDLSLLVWLNAVTTLLTDTVDKKWMSSCALKYPFGGSSTTKKFAQKPRKWFPQSAPKVRLSKCRGAVSWNCASRGFDWCCFYYLMINSLVALLEALFARIFFCLYLRDRCADIFFQLERHSERIPNVKGKRSFVLRIQKRVMFCDILWHFKMSQCHTF